MEGIDAEVVDAGFAKLDPETGELRINADAMLGATYDDTPVMSQLGVTAMPYPATDDGNAQMLVLTNIAGSNGICVGGNDTRTAKIVGNLKPGDTVVHSTGPQQAAQLQLKEEKRQCALVTKDDRKKDFGLFLDGKSVTGTFTVPKGGTIHITQDQGQVLVDNTGKASIQLVDGMIILCGQIIMGGRTPVGSVAGIGPGGPEALKGVFYGI